MDFAKYNGTGKPRMMPSTVEQDEEAAKRRNLIWEAQDLQRVAWSLGGNSAVDHVEADLLEAIRLYELAKTVWERLGDRAYEARCAQYAIDAIRLTIASKRASDAIAAATGRDQ
jgi:hypothetical protein